MNDCHEFEELIDRVHAEEATAGENERVLDHVESCRSCSELFDLVGRLRVESEAVEPSAADFAAMRLGVLRELSARRREKRASRPRWLAFQAMFLRPAFVALLALAMLGIGWVIGGRDRVVSARVASSEIGPVETDDEIITTQIQRVAARNADFEDVANSPYVYSNVQVGESSGEKIRLSFDVSRHLELELAKSDPLVTEVLVQSLIQPASVGTKLKAIDLAGAIIDPRVKRALVVAMQNDANLGVRMTAQAKLAALGPDDEIASAMLEVLERDESVPMRLAAIDYLTRSEVRPELLERAIEAAGKGDAKGAVYIRASRYLSSERTSSQ